MDAITAITERVSVAKLTGPGPNAEQLDTLYRAAFRAPDHAWIRPWRYLTVQGEGLARLGEVFSEAGLLAEPNLAQDKIQKLRSMPARAPVIIIAIANIQPHVKVPGLEQRLAVGSSIQNILTAAYALGLGAIWRTGVMARSNHVNASLGLEDNEEILGFVYVGHVNCKLKKPPVLEKDKFVQDWPLKQ